MDISCPQVVDLASFLSAIVENVSFIGREAGGTRGGAS